MMVNKAQGKTISNVVVYLPEPVFSYDQLYVALSRATARLNIRILALPPNAEEGDEEDEKKDKKNSKKKDKKKPSVKEKKKHMIIRRKRHSRETVHTQRILYIRRS
jgi:ATP-dependent DNA helicase PIF1